MGGLVDLHLHLLPDVDDGARTMADALEMARALVSLGYAQAAPSPHHRSEYAPREVALTRLTETQAALDAAKIPLALHANAESFFMDERLLAEAPGPTGRRLAGGPFLLVEAPYTTTLPTLLDIVFRLQVKGVTPIVAHPERCLEFEKKGRLSEVVNAGALAQLDVGALTGRYGKTAQKLARGFLGDGLYAVAASDAHSPTNLQTWLGEALAALEKEGGAGTTERLCGSGPRALLQGRLP